MKSREAHKSAAQENSELKVKEPVWHVALYYAGRTKRPREKVQKFPAEMNVFERRGGTILSADLF